MSSRFFRSFSLAIVLMVLAFSPALAQPMIEVPGVGDDGQGAGVVLTNLDNNPRPDMILMAYDNPPGQNTFRYRVGFNLNVDGFAQNWSDFITVDGVGHEGQGAGLAIANLDRNARPELILMAYDNSSGQNTFRYRVGFNLNTTGIATSWSDVILVDGVGHEGQGAEVIVTNLDNSPRPELILMAYDNPPGQNTFRYRVGFNLNTTGIATSWSSVIQVDGVGHEGQGAGLAITHLDGNDQPDMILMAYDNPPGQNTFRYRVGFNLAAGGTSGSLSATTVVDGAGHEGEGAGMALMNLDGDPRPDMILMAYDNSSGANTFRYRIVSNAVPSKQIHLEMDKLASVNWPPASILRGGVTHTLQSIYNVAGIDLAVVQHQGGIADLHPGIPYTDAELDAFRVANMNNPPPPGSLQWHIYACFLTNHVDGILGLMWDTGQRRAFAVFVNAIPDNERYLRTTAHELGHALNLEHSDGDGWAAAGPVAGQGRTIMNQTWTLASDWDYGWSAADLHHFYNHPLSSWRPQSGVTFENCH